MTRRLLALLLVAPLAFAQEGRDDEGISIDEQPKGPEPEPLKARPAREPGAKVGTVVVTKGVHSITVPEDWVMIEDNDPKAMVSWKVLLPGSETRGLLAVLDEETSEPRSMPYDDAGWFREHHPDRKLEIRMKPWPQLLVTEPPDAEVRSPWINWFHYRLVKNRVFAVRFSCTAEDFARYEADMLEAARSYAADVPPWPAIPKGYKTSPQGTWLLATAPGVTASMTPILKVLKEQEQRFRRDHGALPRLEAPFVVFVHNEVSDAAKIEPKAAEWEDDFHADPWQRRVFAVPLDKEKPENDAWLASCAQKVLFVVRYGDAVPDWVYQGEGTLARAEAITGKPLPVLDAGFYSWSKDMTLHKLGQLPALRESDWSMYCKESFFYIASLHEGKHKKAYAKFLADFAETGDGEGAFKRELAPIGDDDIHAAAIEFTYQRIKPLEKKQKEK